MSYHSIRRLLAYGRQPRAASLKRFFHGSDTLFETGDILTPQADSYARMDVEEVRRVEDILEAHRPEGHLARADSIFLSSTPEDVIRGRGGWSVRNMYQVAPSGQPWASNVAWMVEIEENLEAEEVVEWARRYWSAAPHPDGDIIEYRVTQAEIKWRL